MDFITRFKQLKTQLTEGFNAALGAQRLLKSTRPSQATRKRTDQRAEQGAREVLEALALLGAEPPPDPTALGDTLEPPSERGPEARLLHEELALLITLDQAPSEPQANPAMVADRGRSASVLLSSSGQHLSFRASAWEVLCMTLKLAKVFPRERCQGLAQDGGALSVLELQQVKQHIDHVLLKSMERGDYLFADLSLSDLSPQEAFKEGDPRREEHLDRASLLQLTAFAREARGTVMVRRLQWRSLGAPLQTGDPNAIQRAKRAQRGGL